MGDPIPNFQYLSLSHNGLDLSNKLTFQNCVRDSYWWTNCTTWITHHRELQYRNPNRKHQPQNSFSESVLTYPKQFCLHTIEYYSISHESHTQSILTITCILNHFKLLRARWSRPVNTSNKCKSKLALPFTLISIRSILIHFPRSGSLSRIFPWS